MKVILLISYLIGSMIYPIQFNNVTPIAGAVPVEPTLAQEIIKLNTVNGISLYDEVSTVTAKLAAPEQIITDPHFIEYKMYVYANMTISFRNDIMDSVEVSANASTVMLDQVELPITIEAIQLALGEPDYVAEDGLVFQRNEALLKLFIDQDSKQLQSIAFYHIAST